MSHSHPDNEREKSVPISQATPTGFDSRQDIVAVEEPMEIRVVFGPAEKRRSKSLSVTMRTPGNDFELAAGFLFTEGVISESRHLSHIEFCGPVAEGQTVSNLVSVELSSDVEIDLNKLKRHFYTTSSCGICGKASLDAIQARGLNPIESSAPSVKAAIIHSLPARLRTSQDVFDRTGGLHAAGLFDFQGDLISIREDVGRHNALDKLIGEQLLADNLPLAERIIVVSGRASFELMQKALAAAAPLVVAVGAPSSLAVELANEFNLTLIGFTSASRFNIYSASQRVAR
jgi:FdhD protein